MINLKLLNLGLKGALTPSEFITLYVIESALGKDNAWKKLYYEMIADLTNLSIRQVKRNVDSLIEKGFINRITKQISKTKRECFYSLNLDKNDTKTTSNLDTGVILNNCKQLYKNENNCKQLYKDKNNISNTVTVNTVNVKQVSLEEELDSLLNSKIN